MSRLPKVLRLFVCLLPWLAAAAQPANAGSLHQTLDLLRPLSQWEQGIERFLVESKKDMEDAVGPFRLYGDAYGFYQYTGRADIDGRDESDYSGAGLVAELKADWRPWRQGLFHTRVVWAQGAVDDSPDKRGLTFYRINASNSDAVQNGRLRLKEVTYTRHFSSRDLFVSLGRTDAETFLDGNAYANSRSQFYDTVFNNDPVFDSEDALAPFVAAGVKPAKGLRAIAYASSSTHSMDPEHDKGEFDDPFDSPFFGAHLGYAASPGGKKGEYRLMGWSATYQRPTLGGTGRDMGYGIGLSANQEIGGGAGLFARAGWANPDVYPVVLSLSGGASVKGISWGRPDDTAALGVGALKASPDAPGNDWEYHLEAYYRIKLTDALYVSPHLQYVAHPQADAANQGLASVFLRASLTY